MGRKPGFIMVEGATIESSRSRGKRHAREGRERGVAQAFACSGQWCMREREGKRERELHAAGSLRAAAAGLVSLLHARAGQGETRERAQAWQPRPGARVGGRVLPFCEPV